MPVLSSFVSAARQTRHRQSIFEAGLLVGGGPSSYSSSKGPEMSHMLEEWWESERRERRPQTRRGASSEQTPGLHTCSRVTSPRVAAQLYLLACDDSPRPVSPHALQGSLRALSSHALPLAATPMRALSRCNLPLSSRQMARTALHSYVPLQCSYPTMYSTLPLPLIRPLPLPCSALVSMRPPRPVVVHSPRPTAHARPSCSLPSPLGTGGSAQLHRLHERHTNECDQRRAGTHSARADGHTSARASVTAASARARR